MSVTPLLRVDPTGSNMPNESPSNQRVKGAIGLRETSIVSEHFKIKQDALQPGIPEQDDNTARDYHDWFNIVTLIPMNILNAMNWTWSSIGQVAPPDMWNGRYFHVFYFYSCSYFLIDALWVLIVPKCVRSPGVILQHHVAAMGYMLIPWFYTEYAWLAGVNLSVEVNTWLIIARRLFNKSGLVVWDVGAPFKIKIISIFFYITWFVIRIVAYPYLFIYVIFAYVEYSNRIGNSYLNPIAVCPVLQAIFCLLNFKWTYDLAMSKLKAKKGDGPSKGL